MTKMVLGSSNSQGSSATSVTTSRVSSYEGLMSSLNNFAGEGGLYNHFGFSEGVKTWWAKTVGGKK